MPITEHESGTKTLTDNATEYVLNGTTPETTDGVFTLVLDLADIALGETVVLKIKEKAISGGTQRQHDAFTFANVQANPLISVTFGPFLHGWDVSLTQTVGSGVVVPWSLRKIV